MGRDQKFIEKLENFTKALEDLVELLKEENKKSPSESINLFSSAIDPEIITKISEDVSEVKEKTIEINKNIEKIIESIKELKKEKETGLFDKIEDKDNKKKIVDGVKAVILIAAGVLAIGTAFKIVGDVNILSVMAIGMGIMFVASAFAKVAVLKDDKGRPLTWKQIVTGTSALVILSAGVLASALILKLIPIFNIAELATIVLLGASLGLAAFFIFKSLSNISISDLSKVGVIAVTFPIIAAGIVGAGFVLKLMPTITLSQAFSALFVSIAIAPITIAAAFAMKYLKNVSLEDIFLFALSIPMMSLAIVVSSHILQYVQPVPFFSVLLAGLAIGIATAAMVPTIYLLHKAGLTDVNAIDNIIMGAIAVVVLSTAIAVSSHILAEGRYENYPSFSWSLGVGLSLLAFGFGIYLISKVVKNRIDTLVIGVLSVAIIAAAVALISHIVALGDYSSYPPVEWTLSVGLSLLLFGVPMIALGFLVISTYGIALAALAAGIGGVLLIAEALVEADKILSKGKWQTYPSPDWSKGVGESIRAFSEVMIELVSLQMLSKMISFFFGGGEINIDLPSFIINVSNAILEAAKTFNSAPNIFNKGYPSEDWAKGVGMSIRAFSEVLIELTKLEMIKEMISFFSLGLFGGGGNIDLPTFIEKTARGILTAAKIFNEVEGDIFNKGSYPKEEWAKGVGISIKSFAEAIAAMDEAGVDLDKKDLESDDGAISVMRGLARGIIEVAKVFNENNAEGKIFDIGKIPQKEWGEGIGAALSSFAKAIVEFSKADLDLENMTKKGGPVYAMLALSLALVFVAKEFNKHPGVFNVENIPDVSWSERLSSALNAYTSNKIDDFDSTGIEKVMNSMFRTSITLSFLKNIELPGIDWLSNLEFALHVVTRTFYEVTNFYLSAINIADIFKLLYFGNVLYIFSSILSNIEKKYGAIYESDLSSKIAKSINTIIEALPSQSKIDPLWSLVNALKELSRISWFDLLKIGDVAKVVEKLSHALSDTSARNMEAIAKLGAGLHLISLIDEMRLAQVLRLIEEKEELITQIISDDGYINKFLSNLSKSFLLGGESETSGLYNTASEKTSTDGVYTKFEEELLGYVKNIDENISKMAGITEEERLEKLEAKNVEGTDK